MPAPKPLIRWHSHAALTKVVPGSSAILILVADPGFKLMQPHRFNTVLDLEFFDSARRDPFDRVLVALFGRWPSTCKRIRSVFRKEFGWPWRPPLPADAIAIGRFLNGPGRDASEIHVSSHYGKSRSRCIAEWLAARHGTRAEGSLEGKPNALLMGLLERYAG